MKLIFQLCYSSWIVSHDWPLLCRVIIHSHCVNKERNTLKFLFFILIPFPIFISFLITTAGSSYSHVLPLYIQQGSSSHFLGFSLIPCHSHFKLLQHDQYNSEQLRAEQNRTEQNRTTDLTCGAYFCPQNAIFLLLNCQLVYLTIREIVNM